MGTTEAAHTNVRYSVHVHICKHAHSVYSGLLLLILVYEICYEGSTRVFQWGVSCTNVCLGTTCKEDGI